MPTTDYSAPELIHGEYGYHSDIWSLGLIYLELLVPALNHIVVAKDIPARVNSIVDPQLKALIGAMLSQVP